MFSPELQTKDKQQLKDTTEYTTETTDELLSERHDSSPNDIEDEQERPAIPRQIDELSGSEVTEDMIEELLDEEELEEEDEPEFALRHVDESQIELQDDDDDEPEFVLSHVDESQIELQDDDDDQAEEELEEEEEVQEEVHEAEEQDEASGDFQVVDVVRSEVYDQTVFSMRHIAKLHQADLKKTYNREQKGIERERGEFIKMHVDEQRKEKAERRVKKFVKDFDRLNADVEASHLMGITERAEVLLKLYELYGEELAIFRAFHNEKYDTIREKRQIAKESGKKYRMGIEEQYVYDVFSLLKKERYLARIVNGGLDSEKKRELAKKAGIYIHHSGALAQVRKEMQKAVLGEEGQVSDVHVSDKGLTEVQSEALDHINRWLIHQFYSRTLGFMKDFGHTDADFALDILRRSKREQLFAFYAIETGLKTQAGKMDAVAAQSYVPNIAVIKRKMLTYYSDRGGFKSGAMTVMKTVSRYTLGEIVHWTKIESMMRRIDANDQEVKKALAYHYTPKNFRIHVHHDDVQEIAEKKEHLSGLLKERNDIHTRLAAHNSKLELLSKEAEGKKEGEEKDILDEQIKTLAALIGECLTQISNLSTQIDAEYDTINAYYNTHGQESYSLHHRSLDTGDDTENPVAIAYKRFKQGVSDTLKYAGLAGQFGQLGTDKGSILISKLGELLEIPGALSSAGCIAKIGHAVFDFIQLDKEQDSLTDDEIKDRLAQLITQSEGILNTFAKAVVHFSGFSTGAKAALTPLGHVAGFGAGIGLCCDVTRLVSGVRRNGKIDGVDERIDETQMSESTKRMGKNVAKMCSRYNHTKEMVAAIDAVGHTATIVGAVFPSISTVCTAISVGAILGSMVTEFIRKKGEKNDALDDYMGLTDWVQKLRTEGKVKIADGDVKKFTAEVRKEILGMIGYSSYDELFDYVTDKYTNVLYNTVFYDDSGEPILAADADKISARAPYAEVLAGYGLRVKYPREAGMDPKPSKDLIIAKLKHIN